MSKINWSSYNTALKNRGNISFWFSEDVVDSWYAIPDARKKGAPFLYSSSAIEVLNVIRFRFGMKLRETQGFAESIKKLMDIDVQIPDYTTLSRRMNTLMPEIRQKLKTGKSVHVVVDSTGLKVFGEGEWKVRQHGYSKRRTWRKLHLAVDESDSQILSVVLSENSFKDSELLGDLVEGIHEDIDSVTGDGAYDCKDCHEVASTYGAMGIFPPKRGARLKQHGNSNAPPILRDEFVRAIRAVGRKAWKKDIGYHRRSLAETAMYRFKTLLGEKLSSRIFDRQAIEAILKCKILNMMPVPATCQ
jgi:hypothetical protein